MVTGNYFDKPGNWVDVSGKENMENIKAHLRYCFGERSGLARNRTWIWSFGNSYTIRCTTRPI
jgi:hypothetical protein